MHGNAEDFDFKGLRFRCSVHHDPYMGEPWKEHDGHGVVSEWTDRPQQPGELVLATDGNSHRFYDLNASLAVADREGWGVEDPAAVHADYERLKAWCDDEWYWVFVDVQLLDLDGNEVPGCGSSLSGIESDAGDYFLDVREQLAGQIIGEHDLDGKTEICLKIRHGFPRIPLPGGKET